MAGIEFRSGSWRVYWRLGGGRGGEKQSVTFPAEDEEHALSAQRIAAAHKHRLTRDEVLQFVLGLPAPAPVVEKPKLPTVAEWADQWLASRTRITPGVRGRYRAQLDNELLPRIGQMRLDEVSILRISEVLNDLRNGRKDSTVTRYYAVLHGLFGLAVSEGLITKNPAQRTDWIRDLVQHDDIGDEGHVYLTRGEFRMIHDAASEWARPLLQFLVDTGCRFHEATAVNVGDVNLLGKKPAVRVVKGWKQDEAGKWYRGSTKGRNRRTVSIPAGLVEVLVPLVANAPSDRLLFRSPEGDRVHHSNFRGRHWLPAVAAAARCQDHPPLGADGEPSRDKLATSTCDCDTRLRQIPTPHDLRHTHAAWLIALGRQIAYISKRLGHHSTSITERVYAGILPEVDETAMDAYNEAATAAAGGAPDAAPDEEPARPARRAAARSSRQLSRSPGRPRR